jgi:beta-lactamase superfamily II metal-dependent hydrolase
MNTKRLFTLSFIIVALIALGYINALAIPQERIELAFIDVGQGDSALISDSSGIDVLNEGLKSSAIAGD